VLSGAEGGDELRGVVQCLPNRAPDVELVIGQPQYGQTSVTSTPYIGRRGRLQMTDVLGMPGQLHPPSCAGVTVSNNSQSAPKLYVVCHNLKTLRANPLCPLRKLILKHIYNRQMTIDQAGV